MKEKYEHCIIESARVITRLSMNRKLLQLNLTEETEKKHLIQSIVQKILDDNLIEIETIADEERDEETIIARLHILTKIKESQ